MRFLIGIDGSREAGRAIEFVHALALRPDDELILAVVAEMPTSVETFAGPPATLGWYAELRPTVLERCHGVLERATAEVWGPARVGTALVEGHPLHELLTLARDRAADAVVVGPHGHGVLESLVMGSVSQGLLHAGTVPVIVARPVSDALRRVVLGVDGSPGSRAAVEWLATLPLPAGTEVHAIAVVPSHEGPLGRAWSDELYPRVMAAEQEAAHVALEDASTSLRKAGLAVVCGTRTGLAKAELVDAAHDLTSDLIVVGARGLGGFEELVLGSVSRAVAKAAPCSVAVVHRRSGHVGNGVSGHG